MIHIVKGFGVVDITKVDVFLELSSFLCDLGNVRSLISGLSGATLGITDKMEATAPATSPLSAGMDLG